jgi:thiamine-monophosphate kinase
MTAVLEHALIERLAAGLPRSPHQLNRLHESDAELVRLPGTGAVLAVTTDALEEEVATGLYDDPELIGWMLVTVNASDLAAVGADPLGILLCQTLPPETEPGWLDALQRGIRLACEAYDLPVLGGDVNAGAAPHLSATAVGLVPDGRPLTRRGCAPGDRVFASRPLGLGNAYAVTRLDPRCAAMRGAINYRPRARLAEGRLLRSFASCCMDTSDAGIATLDELMRRNGVGMRLTTGVAAWTDPTALALAQAAGLPPWMLHAGPHGEFELVFTVPEDRVSAFLVRAGAAGWAPVPLGVVTTEGSGLALDLGGSVVRLDAGRARNLFTETRGDLARFIAALAALPTPD